MLASVQYNCVDKLTESWITSIVAWVEIVKLMLHQSQNYIDLIFYLI